MNDETMTPEGKREIPGFEGPRPARRAERGQLLEMVNYVFRVSRGLPATIAEDWPHVYEPENLANVIVVCERGDTGNGQGRDDVPAKIVASTGVWACDVVLGGAMLRVGGINCVGTLPDYRRHGFGSQVMLAAHQTMRDLGCQVGLLSTGITNWYRRLGWEEAGSQRNYHLNRGNVQLLPLLRPGLRVRMVELNRTGDRTGSHTGSLDTASLEAAARLHDAQRMGAVRTPERFRQLIVARQIQRIAFAETEEGAVAYLLLHEHSVLEWAGPAPLVAALLRAVFERLDDPNASASQRATGEERAPLRTLTVQMPGWQHPLAQMLDARRIPYNADYVGMVLLLDPQAVLDAYGIENVRVEAAGELYLVHSERGTLTLDRQQLTKLFFGPERVSDNEPHHFPLPFWQWRIDRV